MTTGAGRPGDRYPTRVADRPALLDRTEPTVWGADRPGPFTAAELAAYGNTTPHPRSNLFVVFNSVENALVEPFAAPAPRPSHVAARTVRPV